MSSFDPFWLPQFHTFPHHWTVSLAKHSPMTFTNVLENLITVCTVKKEGLFTQFGYLSFLPLLPH